jgi:hypothetical protein
MLCQRRIFVAVLAALAAPPVTVAQDLHPSRPPSPLGWSRR